MSYALFETIQSWTGDPVLDELMVLIATYLILIIPLSLIALWLVGHRRRSFTIFVITVAAIAIAQLLGLGFYHDPPHLQGYETILENDPENAFPSNHAASIFGFAAGTIYVRYRRFAGIALAFALLIGFARVYTGLHFPIDIAGGALAAALAVAVLVPSRPVVESVFVRIRALDDAIRERIPGIDPP